jgi:hypothetical protein
MMTELFLFRCRCHVNCGVILTLSTNRQDDVLHVEFVKLVWSHEQIHNAFLGETPVQLQLQPRDKYRALPHLPSAARAWRALICS